MPIYSASITLETQGEGHTSDLTSRVQEALTRTGYTSGIVTVFVPSSTCGVTTLEFEPGVVADVAELFDRLAPQGRSYNHEAAWHDGNGHSHVRAALLGPSLTLPFIERKLALGEWQQIVLVDFDNRPRRRRVMVQVIGE